MDTHRLESLTDNVFAVAMTLLVFDLKTSNATVHESLGAFLFNEWPHYLGYVIGFLVIAIIWLQHHWVFRHLKTVDATVFIANVTLMLLVAVVPYATSTMASYIVNRHDQRSAAVFFGAILTAATAALSLQWWWAASHRTLLQDETPEATIDLLNKRLLIAPALYLAATLLALTKAGVGIATFAAIDISLFWLLRPGVITA